MPVASDPGTNHCAHFVSHMLDYDFPSAASCKTYTLPDKRNNKVTGGAIRVNEIYNRIIKARKMPVSDNACFALGLIFVTQKRNMGVNGRMGDKRYKHIGILLGQWVYHYGNTYNKVKKERLSSFIRTFTRNYRSHPPVVFFRGEFLK